MNRQSKIVKINASTLNLTLCVGLLRPGAVNEIIGRNEMRTERSTGGCADDTTLAEHVRGALNDNPDYKFCDVSADVYHGAAQLSGFVSTLDQKSHAGEITRQVHGVKHVVNNIIIKPRKTL
jgi:hyperosmotically inducible periplasmic protein